MLNQFFRGLVLAVAELNRGSEYPLLRLQRLPIPANDRSVSLSSLSMHICHGPQIWGRSVLSGSAGRARRTPAVVSARLQVFSV